MIPVCGGEQRGKEDEAFIFKNNVQRHAVCGSVFSVDRGHCTDYGNDIIGGTYVS